MAEDFKIGDGYVEINSRVDDKAISKDAEAAGRTFEEEFTKTTTGRVRESRSRFTRATRDAIEPDAPNSGRRFGGKLLNGLQTIFSGLFTQKFTGPMFSSIGTGFMSFAKSPVGLAAIAGFVATTGTLLASGLSATIAGGLTAGLGGGLIGIGAYFQRGNKEVVKAARSLKQVFLNTMEGASEPLAKPIAQALKVFENTIYKLKPVINALFESVAPAIVPLAEGISGAIINMSPGLLALAQRSGPFLIELGKRLPAVGASIGRFFLKIAQNWPEIQKSFFSFMSDVGSVIGGLANAFLWLSTHYEQVKTTLKIMLLPLAALIQGVKNFINVVQFFSTTVPMWFTTAKNAVVGFFTSVWTAVTGAWTSITGFITGVGAAISAGINNIVAWFQALPGRVAAFLAALPGAVMTWINQTANQAIFAVGFMIGSIVNFFIKLPGRAKAAVAGLWGAITGAFSTAKTNAINAVTSLVNNVVSWIRGLPGKARSAIASLWANMTGAFTTAKNNALNAVRTLVSSTVSFLGSFPGKVRAQVAKIPSAIYSVFKGCGTWLFSIGKQIIQGLINGVGSMAGALGGKARSMAGNFISGFKSALRIGSPSRVAADEIGRWIPPGIAMGVDDAMPDAQKQIQGITKPSVETAIGVTAEPAKSAPAAGGFTGNLTVNVRGILDPSDPASFRRMIAELQNALSRYERSYA